MRKTKERPALRVGQFDVGDVITASSGTIPIQNALDTVGDFMENMIDVFNRMGQ